MENEETINSNEINHDQEDNKISTKTTEDLISEIANLEKKYQELLDSQTKTEEENDKLKRFTANLQNESKNKIELLQRESERQVNSEKVKLLKQILPFFSVLTQGAASITDDNAKKGLELILDSILKIFEKSSIKLINPKIGSDFDYKIYEALGSTAAPSPEQKETVAQVISPGFSYTNKGEEQIIVTPQVIVFN